jgi:hypothetical protein
MNILLTSGKGKDENKSKKFVDKWKRICYIIIVTEKRKSPVLEHRAKKLTNGLPAERSFK